jgi:hypothetical protein
MVLARERGREGRKIGLFLCLGEYGTGKACRCGGVGWRGRERGMGMEVEADGCIGGNSSERDAGT